MVDRRLVLKWAHLGRIRNPRDCERAYAAHRVKQVLAT
jgi:hypothetical protein